MMRKFLIFAFFFSITSFGQRNHQFSVEVESLVRHDKYLNNAFEIGYLNSGTKIDFSAGIGGRNIFHKSSNTELMRNGFGVKFDLFYKIKIWSAFSWGVAVRNKLFWTYYRYSYSMNSSTGEKAILYSKGLNWKVKNSQHFIGPQIEYLPFKYLSIKAYVGCLFENYLMLNYIWLKNYHPYVVFGLNASFQLPGREVQ